jgi:GT2 family glycosyltransferase
MKKILIICVDFNSAKDTKTFINSVLSMDSFVEVTLILNSGNENFSEDFLTKERLHVFDYGKNLGYMQGASEGLKSYLVDHALPDWIILSNTDIDFPERDFFVKLANDNRNNCIIAPEVISADGVPQNPFLEKRISEKKLKFLIKVNSNAIISGIYATMAKIKSKFKFFHTSNVSASSLIYAPHGAFIIISSEYFKSGESLDHPAFLYGEELLIAERAARSGITIHYDKGYSVLHAEHVATGKMPGAFRAKSLRDSLAAVLKEFY